MTGKIYFTGTIVSVQPRIRLLRSFDERQHSYLGYQLIIDGDFGPAQRRSSLGVGKAALAKHQFQVGHEVSGHCQPIANSRTEAVDFYKASKMKVLTRDIDTRLNSQPWHGVPLELPVYRARGHRRLDKRIYEAKCFSCIWGCNMPVEMIIDPWVSEKKEYRQETWCYGPKSCPLYKAGPTRKVPGRNGMVYEEEDLVDNDATSHRTDDE